MTDVVVERILRQAFLGITPPLARKVKGKGVYENVSFPNETFTRPNGMWYEVAFIGDRPSQVELGTDGRSRWTGILQISVCYPKGIGTKGIEDAFDRISSRFTRGSIHDGVRIRRVYRSSARTYDDYYSVPVSVEWEADLDR